MSEPIMEIDEDGTKRWLLNGLLHREDGPAIELASGYMRWYINGCPYSKEEYTLLMFFGK